MSEGGYAVFTSKLIPGADNILGVRTPALRKIAKRLAVHGAVEYLAETDLIWHEEILLQGMIIGYMKMPWREREAYVAAFVPKINNWAVCDGFCAGLKFTESEREEVWRFLQPYLRSDKAYEIRFGVVMLLGRFVEERYAEAAFAAFDRITDDDYYVRMAVAWAVSIYYRDLPETGMEYLKNNKLDDWTHNKALQKIVESLAVEDEAKAVIRSLKRKK